MVVFGVVGLGGAEGNDEEIVEIGGDTSLVDVEGVIFDILHGLVKYFLLEFQVLIDEIKE